MGLFSKIEKNLEVITGLSINNLRDFSPEKLRTYLEKRNNRELAFVSEFPYIGRGNILRDGIASSREINQDVDKILRIK